jgi:hypothetical protein
MSENVEPIDVRGLSRDDYRAAKAALRNAPVAPSYTTEQRRELIERDLAEIEASGAKIRARETVVSQVKPLNVRDMDETVYQQYRREFVARNRRG